MLPGMQQTTSKWLILGGVMVAILLSSLDQTIVSTAMPTIVQELHGIEHLSWVFTAYMLGSTVTVPVYGKLSDLFGRRRLYLIGIGIFLLGSMLCSLSGNMTQLILFRGLQGIGGGAMMVNSFAIIGDVFPPAERGKYQGLIGGMFGLSSVAGPLLGGWITDHTSWRWVFYVNLPLGIAAIAILAAALPKITPHHRDKRIDWLGAFFIIATLVPLLLSLVWGGSIYDWNSAPILISLSVALASLILFIRTERRVANPILSLDLFRNRVFLVSVTTLFLTAMGMFGAILYIPLYAQGVIGGSATEAGMILTPMMLSLVVASAISGQLISRTGRYKALAITGTAITVLALFLFSSVTASTSKMQLILRMIVLGVGLGSTMPVFTLAVQSAFDQRRLGEVTARTQLFRSIGGTVGTAILAGIMNMRLSGEMRGLGDEPFLAQLKRLEPAATSEGFDGSVIQSVLNPQNQTEIAAMISRQPQAQQAPARAAMEHFVASSRVAFSHALDGVFLVAALLMAVALIVVCFLPEIPLRKSLKPLAEEVGQELEDELGNYDEDCLPERHAAGNRRGSHLR